MRIVVFGADGGVGRRAVAAARAAGHGAVAVAQSPPVQPQGSADVRRVQLGARDTDGVCRLFADLGSGSGSGSGGQADALLWCIGVWRRSGPDVGRSALPTVLAATQEAGVSTVVTVSGAAVTLPEDRKRIGARAMPSLTQRLARNLMVNKEAEHVALVEGGLSWTGVRPSRLVDADGRGRWALVDDAPGPTAAAVPKGDFAAVIVQLAATRSYDRLAPFLVATRAVDRTGVEG